MNLNYSDNKFGVSVRMGTNKLGCWCILQKGDSIRISSRGATPQEAYEEALDQMIAARLIHLALREARFSDKVS